MERYCHLHCQLVCPVCRTSFEDAKGEARFCWGLLGAEYHLNDPIRWGTEPSGLQPWLSSVVRGAPEVRGKPGLDRVCIFDSDDDYSYWRCSKCDTEFDRPAISIDRDVIVGVSLIPKANVVDEFGIDRGDNDVIYFDIDHDTWKIFEDAE